MSIEEKPPETKKEKLDVAKEVMGMKKEDYGDKYRDHILDIYKTYASVADKTSERRQTANSFFLTLNTTIIGLVGYVSITGDPKAGGDSFFFALIAVTGMLLSFLWYRMILSYKQMNSGRFKVINTIENLLPLRPYNAEWIALGEGRDPKLYTEFTRVEKNIPRIFFLLHMGVFLLAVIPIALPFF